MPLENVNQIIEKVNKKILLIISPTRDTSNEKPRFVCERFARRDRKL